MFQFSPLALISLWIQERVTEHDLRRVSPFGHPRINAYVRLPEAFRSLSRPSSPVRAKASTVRPCSLDRISSLPSVSRRGGGLTRPTVPSDLRVVLASSRRFATLLQSHTQVFKCNQDRRVPEQCARPVSLSASEDAYSVAPERR
jgi:hypothetical protein